MSQAKRAITISMSALVASILAGCADQPVAPHAVAAAEEGSYTASEALNAYITGPAELLSGQAGTWTANPSGGDGTYVYQWQYKKVGSTLWTNVGISSTYARAAGDSFDLKLTVWSGGTSVVRGIRVTVPDSCGSTC